MLTLRSSDAKPQVNDELLGYLYTEAARLCTIATSYRVNDLVKRNDDSELAAPTLAAIVS